LLVLDATVPVIVGAVIVVAGVVGEFVPLRWS